MYLSQYDSYSEPSVTLDPGNCPKTYYTILKIKWCSFYELVQSLSCWWKFLYILCAFFFIFVSIFCINIYINISIFLGFCFIFVFDSYHQLMQYHRPGYKLKLHVKRTGVPKENIWQVFNNGGVPFCTFFRVSHYQPMIKVESRNYIKGW